jgi:hypothetical protein
VTGSHSAAGTAFLAGLLILGCRAGEKPPELPKERLRDLGAGTGKEYRTPMAGEGFRTVVFDEEVAVQPRDRRFVSAWDAGFIGNVPGVHGGDFLPAASLYFWQRPDENEFLRAVIVGAYDDVFYSRSTDSLQPFEGILRFENYTVPIDQAPFVDGQRLMEEELTWGYLRPGIGAGFRRNLEEPRETDNMFALSFLFEPGYDFFFRGHDTADDYVVPQDTFVLAAHIQTKLDAMERNLLDLAHRGFALGGDALFESRLDWEDWGYDGEERAGSTRDHTAFSGYAIGAMRLPFQASERHRLLGYLYGGIGDRMDRFSYFRLGGGPTGEEYGTNARLLLPGALLEEFLTPRYLCFIGEYRWEAIFFSYLSLRSSVAYLERWRKDDGEVEFRDDVLASVGTRVTTGFFFKTRLQFDYNYNFGVLRYGDYGGHEFVVHFSGSF